MIRHAKSSWKRPELADFERPLNGRGKRDIVRMASVICRHIPVPDLFLASPAKRARKTAKAIAGAMGAKAVLCYSDEIYGADLVDLLSVVANIDDQHGHAFLCGHNPSVTDLVNKLAGLNLDLPTCAVAHMELPSGTWQAAVKVRGKLTYYSCPKSESD